MMNFSPYNCDERQFCSPEGINLPFGCLSHTYVPFRITTPRPTISISGKPGSRHSLAAYRDIVAIRRSQRPLPDLQPMCEPQLGKRSALFIARRAVRCKGTADGDAAVLNFSDGDHSLLDVLSEQVSTSTSSPTQPRMPAT